MKRLLMLMSLMALVFTGVTTFAQEAREREERARINRMGVYNEDNIRRLINEERERAEREKMEYRRTMPMRGPGMRKMMAPPPGAPMQRPAGTCGGAGSKCGQQMQSGCQKAGPWGCGGIKWASGSKCGGCPVMGNQKKAAAFCHLMLVIMLIIHILATIWVYQDIKERKTGSGIWIFITLLTGLFGTAVYALVRIGDGKK